MKTSHRPWARGLRLAAPTVLIAGLLAGCSAVGVAPWDRDLMAKRAMQFNSQPEVTAAMEHVYFSKEGSSGGRSFDGGGCGCN
jgi:Domain of unknown function (DUF4266)